MASAHGCSPELAEASKDQANMEFDEDDLFEIDLEAVNNIPPPRYWESGVTATESALLANCLLPISDLSSAVPMVSRTCRALSLAGMDNVMMVIEPMALGKLLQLSCLGGFGIQLKNMNA